MADRTSVRQEIDITLAGHDARVLNTHGYRDSKIEVALAPLYDAAERIDRAGFGRVLDGVIVALVSPKEKDGGLRTFAQYDPVADIFTWFMWSRRSYGDRVSTCAHEIGHRYWFRFMNQSQRTEFALSFNQQSGSLSSGDRQLYWFVLTQAKWNVGTARRMIGDQMNVQTIDGLRSLWLGALKRKGLRSRDLAGLSQEDIRSVQREFVQAHIPYVRNPMIYGRSVSHYGGKNYVEDFAETFAHMVLHGVPFGQLRTPAERFLKAIRQWVVEGRQMTGSVANQVMTELCT